MWSNKSFKTLLGVLLVATGMSFLAPPVAAQDGDQTCITQDITTHFWVNGPQQSQIFPVSIPAGTVSIPSASSHDYYDGRHLLSQPSEKWQLQFLDADGNIVALSAPTEDVPDGEDDQTWTGPLPDVALTAPVSGIRAIHRPDLPFDGQGMSVWATGITLCWDNQLEPPSAQCPDDADGNTVEPNQDGSCPAAPDAECPDDVDGNTVEPNEDGTCPAAPDAECPDDADGNTVEPNEDGTCPTPDPLGPTISCGLDDNGNKVDPNEDGSCPGPDPLGPTVSCGTNPNGSAIQPNADGSCPVATLPITGLQSTVLMALTGLFALAAGWALVLRPRDLDLTSFVEGDDSI